jgi:hypothetical protein
VPIFLSNLACEKNSKKSFYLNKFDKKNKWEIQTNDCLNKYNKILENPIKNQYDPLNIN